jgi:hypothetical protein
MIAAALLGAFGRVVEAATHRSFGIDAPSTKAASSSLPSPAPLLVVLAAATRSAEERPQFRAHVLYADQLNAYDVVVSDDIVFARPRSNPSWPRERQQEVPHGASKGPVTSPRARREREGYGLIDDGTRSSSTRAPTRRRSSSPSKIFGVKVASVNTLNRTGKTAAPVRHR